MSAGGVFFWRGVLPGRSAVATAYHEQVDLGHKIHIRHKVHHAVRPPLILHNRVQDVLLGEGPELRKVALLDLEYFQLLVFPEQAAHTGLAYQLFILLCQRPQQRRQTGAASRQQLDAGLGELDALFYHQVGHITAYIH